MYRELAPANSNTTPAQNDTCRRRGFKPRLSEAQSRSVPRSVEGDFDGIIDLADTSIVKPPSSGVLPVPGRRIDAEVLRSLLIAIRAGSAIEIEYQSMSRENPDPLWRWIPPHAFGFDGFRWHVRAYCHRRAEFRDFIVGRCFATKSTGEAAARSDDDWKRQTLFGVVLEPNPELTEGQQRAIALDYGMRDRKLTCLVRFALLYYFNKRLRFDVAGLIHQERPVVVANRTQFDEAVANATAQPNAGKRPTDQHRLL